MQSIEEIRKNALDGATHYTNSRYYYFNERWGKWFVYRKTENLWECLANRPRQLKPL